MTHRITILGIAAALALLFFNGAVRGFVALNQGEIEIQ